MAVLNRNDRTQLKNSILAAREIAEEAAERAVNVFAVSENNAPDYLTEEQKVYRLNLRAHGRELGDKRAENGKQTISHLVEEIAYEEWHKMLFARFLAENNLLMYPDGSVNVSLNDCEDLAKDEGYENKWECAAAFASKMLPMIFKTDSLTSKIKFSPADSQKLEEIIEKINSDVFFATDALGWCYQFWQEKRKADINNSEVKIGEDEISPVTQLFTEPYMVSFLLDNALGAWYAKQVLTTEDLRNAKTEEELREKAALPEMPLQYLRFIFDEENGIWKIAGNTLEDWPMQLKELKVLDPCCGSGHFLVAVFRMLVAIRQKLERTDVDTAIQNVLRENINGLELDGRCVELAVFALAFAAWTYPNSKGYCKLPKLNIACCGRTIRISKTDWEKTVNEHTKDQTERATLDLLYRAFKDAPVLGSLIDPKEIVNDMKTFGADWDSIKNVFTEIVQSTNEDEKEMGLSALGVIETAELLSNEYHWIVTNPPYLGAGKLTEEFRIWLENNYPRSKTSLASVFFERLLKLLLDEKGILSMVTAHEWMFLKTYEKLRDFILNKYTINYIISVGEKGFQSQSAAGAFTVLLTVQNKKNQDSIFNAIDVSKELTPENKMQHILKDTFTPLSQQKQLKNPDKRIVLEYTSDFEIMEKTAKCVVGVQTADDPRYVFYLQEFPERYDDWEFFQNTPNDFSNLNFYEGFTQLLRWEHGNGALVHAKNTCPFRGGEAHGKKCIALHRMRKILPLCYSKTHFHQNLAVIIPKDENDLLSILCYCENEEYTKEVRKIDKKLNVTNATLVKVPFDKERWQKVAVEKYPNGLPKPFTDDPTQWIFHGHPCKSVIWNVETKNTSEGKNRIDSNVLQIAIARLIGYEWPAENDKQIELAPEQRKIADSVKKEFAEFVDDDGIVCIPALNREKPAGERIISLLAKAYGKDWSQNILSELLKSCGFEGKTIDTYLRDGFFKEHCKLFNNRPFIWQIWDGLNDGFSVLVNYHKLDNKLLTKLIYTVLGDWIQKQKTDYQAGVDGSERKLEAAQALQKKLIAILEGDSPVDIFVRWKKLEEQPIGWNPDLNDGVRMNIRPFILAGDVKVRGAGVLRDKFNINWNKDRGKDAETSPWFNEFKGERINDYHITLQQKKDAKK